MLEQPALPLEATAEAREITVRSNDSMAGDDDRDGILPIRSAHGACFLRITELASQLAVARRRPVGDGAQQLPDSMFELRALGVERQIERRARAREILGELRLGRLEHVVLPCSPEFDTSRFREVHAG